MLIGYPVIMFDYFFGLRENLGPQSILKLNNEIIGVISKTKPQFSQNLIENVIKLVDTCGTSVDIVLCYN